MITTGVLIKTFVYVLLGSVPHRSVVAIYSLTNKQTNKHKQKSEGDMTGTAADVLRMRGAVAHKRQ